MDLADALALFQSMPLDVLPPATTILPTPSRMPFARNGQFVGREQELLTLALAIADPAPTVMVSAVAAGLGGIGKTSLAVEFVYRYARYFTGGVFWLNCADPATVPSEVAACAGVLDLPVAGQPLDDQVAAVQRAWLSDIPRLLVFDNCEDPLLLDQWRPPHGGSRVLVTARRGTWPRDLYRIALGVLVRADSIVLLSQLCPRLTPTEAHGLAEDLGDLPLALQLAGSYLATYDHMTVDAYRAQLSLDHDSLKGRGTDALPTRHERDVARTFALSFEQLDVDTPIDALARRLLAYAACFAPGVPIPRDLLLAILPARTAPEDGIDALNRLRMLGLLEGDTAFVLHRLLSRFVQEQADFSVVQPLVGWLLRAQLPLTGAKARPTALAATLPHLRYQASLALMRTDKEAARILMHVAQHLLVAGDYAGARAPLEHALRISETVWGPNHRQTATSLNDLGWLLDAIGDYEAARLHYERALQIREEVLGPMHPDTAASLNNLGDLLRTIDDVAGARPLLERALAIREAVLEPDHPDTATSLTNLAYLLQGLGDYGAAKPLYERVLAMREAVLGRDHPDTANSLNNLATLFDTVGEYTSAQPLYERALAIREGALGPTHPATARSLNNLAYLRHASGDYTGALPLYERSLAIHEAVLGPAHPDTARTLNNLGTLHVMMDNHTAARLLLERALTIQEAVLGANHPSTRETRANLRACLVALDQTDSEEA